MKIALFLVTVSVAGAASAGWEPAAEKRLSAAYHRCQADGDAARGVTVAMMSCTSDEIYRQDARLNQAYTMVMARLPAARRTTLRRSERDWIGQRDAACHKASNAAGGGSASGLEFAGCILHETIKRTIWLERYR